MRQSFRIDGGRLYLRSLTLADAGAHYVGWLNDCKVNRYLESRHVTHTIEGVTEFVRSKINDEAVLFVGMFLNGSDRHIGNIKLEPIERDNARAEVGIMLGDKDSWGKGYATEALKLTVRAGFEHLRLHKLTAGCYGSNIASIKAFQNAGFSIEGVRRSHIRAEDAWEDVILLGILNDRWVAVTS